MSIISSQNASSHQAPSSSHRAENNAESFPLIDGSYFTAGRLNHKICELKARLSPFEQVRFAQGFRVTLSMIEELFSAITKGLPPSTPLSNRYNIALFCAPSVALIPNQHKQYLLSQNEPTAACPYAIKCTSILPPVLLRIVIDYLPHAEVDGVCSLLECSCTEATMRASLYRNRDEEALDLFKDMLRQDLPLSTFPQYLTRNLSKVTQFDFTNYQLRVTREFMTDLHRLMPNLSELILNGHEIEADALTLLPQFKKLETLHLARARFTREQDLLSLQRCASLKTVNLIGVVLTTWKAVLRALPASIERLDCSNCQALNDDALVELEGKNRLTHLTLNRTGVTGDKFRKLPRALVELNLSGCIRLMSLAFLYANHLPLTHIDVSFTNVTGFSLECASKTLRTLSLEGCELLDERSLQEYADTKPRLQSLNIRGAKTTIRREKYDLKCLWLDGLTFLQELITAQNASKHFLQKYSAQLIRI